MGMSPPAGFVYVLVEGTKLVGHLAVVGEMGRKKSLCGQVSLIVFTEWTTSLPLIMCQECEALASKSRVPGGK